MFYKISKNYPKLFNQPKVNIYKRSTYVKVTNKDEIHNDHKYENGLNFLNKPFDKIGNCVRGGFYFTNTKNIHKFYNYGSNLREIFLPKHRNDFVMVDDGNDKWRANMIVLGDKFSLYDKRTYDKFGLNIRDNKYLLDLASDEGRLDVLERYKNMDLFYSQNAVDMASTNGHIHILEWWKSRDNFLYTTESIIGACKNGRIDVLEWWVNMELGNHFYEHIMDYASKYGQIKILEWCMNSKPSMQYYTHNAMDFASENGHLDVLEWWKKSGLKCFYSKSAMNSASTYGHVHILEWWKNSGFECQYSEGAMDTASTNGYVNILEWWKNSGFECRYSESAIEFACMFGYIDILEWWKNSGLPLKYQINSHYANSTVNTKKPFSGHFCNRR